MSYEDRKRASRQQWQQWESDEAEELVARPSVSPGKRTLTMSLPPRPASFSASVQRPMQQKADPAAVMQRKEQAALAEQWRDVALRPDLYDAPVQRKSAGDEEREQGSTTISASGGGQPMPEEVRAKMEKVFGADFSAVRIYEGPQATAMGALAYTRGTDIHFAPGQYNPGSQHGQELLGHELTHVVQQSQGRVQATTQAKGVGINDDAGLEREADEMGARASRAEASISAARSGRFPASGAASNGAVQLLKDPIEGSKKASIIGAASVPVRKSADGKSESVGELEKGAECDIVEVSGSFTKVTGKDKTSGKAITGFVPSAHVSTRARQLGQIAGELDADMNDLYSKSFNADKTVVEEWGATIVEKDGSYSAKHKRTDHDGGSLPGGYKMDVDDGEQVIGGAHSHPYSKSEGSMQGVAFSAADISLLRDHIEVGFQHWVEAGTARFTLVISDEKKAKKFFDNNNTAKIQRTWSAQYRAAKGTFQERVTKAVQGVIGANGANGIEFYATFDDDKQKFDKL